MTWAAQIARLNASVVSATAGFGELSTVTLATGSWDIPVTFSREPTVIGETGAWETIPLAYCLETDLPTAPTQGGRITEASGHRWIIDRADLTDGLWRMVLRADPKT